MKSIHMFLNCCSGNTGSTAKKASFKMKNIKARSPPPNIPRISDELKISVVVDGSGV
jgi:hypothetical protein